MWYKLQKIYVWSNLVRPAAEPRTPWSDTIAYRPLIDDYLDHSGNNYNITSQGSTTLTTLSWVKCLNLSGWPCQVSSINTLTSYSNYTMSLWARVNSNWGIGWNYRENWSWWGGGITLYTWANWQIRRGNTTNRYTSISVLSANTWFHFLLTALNGEWSIYVNGIKTVLKSSWVIAPNHNWTPMYIWGNEGGYAQTDGYVSRLIIEKKGRTSQEVSDYYNGMKDRYGL